MQTRADCKLAVFTQFARDLAGLSTCKRLQVACIVFDSAMTKVLAIGYNGQPAGIPHERCTGLAGSCGCIHAEANAIVKLNTSETGLTLYCTTSPCMQCAGLIINCGRISRVLYSSPYRDDNPLTLLKETGITCERLEQRF